MLAFGRPEALPLLALAAVPFILYVKASANRRRALSALGGRLPDPRWKLLASTAALVLLALASAEPRLIARREVEVPFDQAPLLYSKSVLHVLVLDKSSSMLAADVSPSRCEAARSFARKYLERLPPSDTAALILFSAGADVVGPVLPEAALAALSSYKCGERYTALGDALTAALGLASAAGMPAVVVVVSDGGWNYGSNPLEVAEAFARLNVTLVAVRVGSDPRGGLLGELAAKAGGRFYELDAFSAEALDELAAEARERGRYSALEVRGMAKLVVEEVTPVPPELMLVPALALALAVLADGV